MHADGAIVEIAAYVAADVDLTLAGVGHLFALVAVYPLRVSL